MQNQNYNAYEAAAIFLFAAQNDVRLTSTHICLFFVLFGYWIGNNYQNPFPITRRKIMNAAKISIATYTKCIHQLHDYGYIDYKPSYHPGKGSTVFLNFKTNETSL